MNFGFSIAFHSQVRDFVMSVDYDWDCAVLLGNLT